MKSDSRDRLFWASINEKYLSFVSVGIDWALVLSTDEEPLAWVRAIEGPKKGIGRVDPTRVNGRNLLRKLKKNGEFALWFTGSSIHASVWHTLSMSEINATATGKADTILRMFTAWDRTRPACSNLPDAQVKGSDSRLNHCPFTCVHSKLR